MIYKQKVYLDVNNIPTNCFSISKRFVLDEKYILSININIDKINNKIIANISVLDKSNKILSTIITEDRYENDLYNANFYKICKAYCLTVDIPFTTDVFKIKIFNENINMIFATNFYTKENLKDEILFADFQENLELIDVCMVLLRHFYIINDELANQFFNKSLYFGLKSLEEITRNIDIRTIAESLSHYNTKTSTDFISNLFYERAVIGLTLKKDINKLFWDVIDAEYGKIKDLRLSNLKLYLKL